MNDVNTTAIGFNQYHEYNPYETKKTKKQLEKEKLNYQKRWWRVRPDQVNMEIDGKIIKNIPIDIAIEKGYKDLHQMRVIWTHESVWHTCFWCNTYAHTRIQNTLGCIPVAVCCLLFVTAFWICSLCPFFLSGFKTTNHYCKNCNMLLASKSPL